MNYKEYIFSIKEGLIKTYNIEKYHTNLTIQLNNFNIGHDINIL